MDKHIVFNSDTNRIITFKSEDIHKDIPNDLIKITEEMWRTLLINTEDYKVKNGLSTEMVYSNIDDVVVYEPLPREVFPTTLTVEERLTIIENQILLGMEGII